MDPSFYQGVALIVASIVLTHDQPTLAASILAGHGINLRDFYTSGVDEFDMKILRDLYASEPQLRRARETVST